MKTNNIFKVLGVLILGIFILGFVNASGPCWESIVCTNTELPNASIISPYYPKPEDLKEEYCEIRGLNVDEISQFEIEIIQGQFEGGVKSIRIFVEEPFIGNSDIIYFLLSKATSPTYVLCHEVQPSSGTTENPIRLKTIRFWTASYDQQWFKQNAGMADYDDYEDLKNWNENNTYNNSDKNVLNTSQKGTQETTYTNLKSDTTNWFFYGISLFMFVIGLLLIFTTVTEYSKRR